jgi:hypothetical protein
MRQTDDCGRKYYQDPKYDELLMELEKILTERKKSGVRRKLKGVCKE